MKLDQTDRAIITATQKGLPICVKPYAEIADRLGLSEADLLARMKAMQDNGVIRRIAIAPNHYALGMTANGMTVWDVDDAVASDLGTKIGALEFVSHCYLRPRARPMWPYNLFAMVHGSNREEVEEKRQQIVALLGDHCQGAETLYSSRILKKTGLRLREKKD